MFAALGRMSNLSQSDTRALSVLVLSRIGVDRLMGDAVRLRRVEGGVDFECEFDYQ
jgi:hypothetical protein